MRRVLTALAIGLAFALVLTEPASAGVEWLILGVHSWLLSSGVAAGVLTPLGIPFVTAAKIITGALIVGGVVAANFLLDRRPGALPTIDPGQLKETFETVDGPEVNGVGRFRSGGLKVFGNTAAADRFRVLIQAKGPVDGYEQYFLSGREVIVEADGEVSSKPYDLADGSYIYIENKIGDGTETAWAALVAAFPALWTTAHRIRGIAQTLITYISPGITTNAWMQMYQSGPPDLEMVLRGAKLIYDPRTETYKWTDNGILVAMYVMLTFPEYTLADFDLDFIADEADRADALVETLSGTEKRSRCWGVWSSESARGDVLEQVLRSVGAEIVVRSDGEKIGIALIDDDRVAEVTIPLAAITDLKWRSGPESVERPNICNVKYYSPERNYEMAEVPLHEFDAGDGSYIGPAWARSLDEIDRVGAQPFDIELPFCPSAAQAQRIARRMFGVARGDAGVVLANWVGLVAWGKRAVAFEFPDDLGTALAAIAAPRVNDARGEIEIPFVVWPSLPVWTPAEHEVLPPPIVPDVALQTPLDTPATPTEATVVTYPAAGGTVTRVAYASLEDVGRIEASYRTYTDGKPNAWRGMIEDVSLGHIPESIPQIPHAYVALDTEGIPADFRLRIFDGNNSSKWSNLFSDTPEVDETAPDDPSIFAVNDEDAELATITVAAPANLHVSYLEITGPDSPGIVAAKPGQIFSFTSPTPDTGTLYVVTWTAQAFATGDAGSGIASDSITVPAVYP